MKIITTLFAAAVAIAQSAPPTPAALMTQESVNVFRRFSVDRAKVLEFYGDVLGLKTAPSINMPGGGQMSQFQIGTSQFKFTNAAASRQDKSGPVLDVTGLRVFSFFYCTESQAGAPFTSRGYAAPEFLDRPGRRSAMLTDPDGQWVELVIVKCGDAAAAARFEVGATVSNLEKSRAFYRDFVGLEELPATDSMFGKTYRFRLSNKDSLNTLNLWAAHPGASANTYTAGIQYVISDVEAVDARAKANHITITQPLGPFGTNLRTIWLADPDGITNYFAQIGRIAQR